MPLGWLARGRDGEPLGVKLCVPQRFRCRGEVHLCLMGGAWYVAEGSRGVGLALMKRYADQGDSHVLYTTTVNEISGAIYERFGARVIPGTDHELLGVLRWPPVVEEWLVRRVGRATLSQLAATAAGLRPSSVGSRDATSLVRVESGAELAAVEAKPPPELDDHVTAERDPAFLAWRYFQGGDTRRAVYRFDGGRGSECWVAVNLRDRGHRSQVRTLQVLDLWGSVAPAAMPGLARGLAARHGDRADVLVFRGQPEERRAALLGAGFVHRAFPRAIGTCIDRKKKLASDRWYLVPADGDMGH